MRKRRKVVLAVVGALACASLSAPVAGQTQSNRDAGYKGPTSSENALPLSYFDAVVLIKARRYDEAIALLMASGRLDSADVRNWIGYSHRKMKRMEEARIHYEAALRIDPDHVATLEYFGEWHVEMGQLDGARAMLARIEAICGRDTCEAWRDLSFAITTGVPREH